MTEQEPLKTIREAVESHQRGEQDADDTLTAIMDALDLDAAGVRCGQCGRARTLRDAYDYNPLQVVTGQPVGWYSGDDGELCPQCMTALLRNQ